MKEEKLATESKDEKRLAKTKSGKPFYKKAWFWVVVIVGGLFASNFIYGVIRSISNAYVPIPDVKGLTKKEACEKIEKAGFICKTGYNYDSSDEKQKVSDFNVHSKTDFDDLRNGQFNDDFESKRSMRAKRGSVIEINFESSEKAKKSFKSSTSIGEEKQTNNAISTPSVAPSPNPAKSENKSFRNFLAEYEKFMNKYVDFMKKYKSNPSDMSLISEYGKMIEQYAEWAKKSDNFKDKLSGDDLAEYLKVHGRIMQKLAEVQ